MSPGNSSSSDHHHQQQLYHGVVKLCTDLLTETNAAVVLPAVQLFLATMYVNSSSGSCNNAGGGSIVTEVYDDSSSSEDNAVSPTSSETDNADRKERHYLVQPLFFDNLDQNSNYVSNAMKFTGNAE